jgi:TatD DNase family protein
MLIDTHCHIDQFQSPEAIVRECESRSLRVIAVTNLPSHFSIAANRLRGCKFVTPALGIHPLCAAEGMRKLSTFSRMALHADFIGEIGLDFSKHGVASRKIQERVFEQVLISIRDRPRFVTLHSRGAESEVLETLYQHRIAKAVFHWFTGSGAALEKVLSDGHFVSINPAMLSSASGSRVITRVPKERVLVESDGPFAKAKGQACTPMSITQVYQVLANHWKVSLEEAILQVEMNFSKIVNGVNSQ